MKKAILSFLCLMGSGTLFSPATAQSPYIAKVVEFRPAPGQFVNELPEYESGDTEETMRAKAEEYIAHNNKNMISLGGYGGYVVVAFDHTIVDVPGVCDFKISGNAFYADANPRPDAPLGGSCEPGIVMVAYDRNHNGQPDDDEWYEIAGSEYDKKETLKNYSITYHRPAPDHVATPHPDNKFLNDTTYIRWNDNRGITSYMPRNTFHAQSYYPEWIIDDSLTFTGTRLADNGIDESGNGTYFVLYAYGFGYADNRPNADTLSHIDIGWAVDSEGNPAHLPGADFIKVYTGVNQYNGWLGECSTEILGMEDLHIDAVMSDIHENKQHVCNLYPNPVKTHLIVESNEACLIEILSLAGNRILQKKIEVGTNRIDLSGCPVGIYLAKIGNKSYKIIKN